MASSCNYHNSIYYTLNCHPGNNTGLYTKESPTESSTPRLKNAVAVATLNVHITVTAAAKVCHFILVARMPIVQPYYYIVVC